ncbi:MAG TPA: hypothetical protein DDZ88_06030 [Verrucomicrobiales bacterium]|nr:hypothetical protein [Verrucomicrobiales bacterium]
MKAILTLIAAAAVLGFAAPSTAEANTCHSGATRIVGYASCGTPIIAVYQIVGYDHCGRPVGQWVTQAPRGGYQRPGYGYNPGFSGHQHGYSGYRPSYGRPRSGVSFSFGFGR